MRVIVTGGAGFVGSNLVKEFASRDRIDPVVADVTPENPEIDLPSEVDRMEIDVTDPSTLDFEGADAVVHLVALSPLYDFGSQHEKIHVQGTKNVVEAAEDAGVERFVHMSALGADPEGSTEYIRAKGRAEAFPKESDMEHFIFRPSVIFGPGDEFINGIIDSAETYPVFPLPGGGSSRMQPVNVGDIASMLADAAEGGVEADRNYSIGGPEKLSLRQIAEKVFESVGRSPLIFPVPMFLVFIGLAIAHFLPFVPYGLDQYRALKLDNTTEDNDISEFGLDEANLKSLEDYLEERTKQGE